MLNSELFSVSWMGLLGRTLGPRCALEGYIGTPGPPSHFAFCEPSSMMFCLTQDQSDRAKWPCTNCLKPKAGGLGLRQTSVNPRWSTGCGWPWHPPVLAEVLIVPVSSSPYRMACSSCALGCDPKPQGERGPACLSQWHFSTVQHSAGHAVRSQKFFLPE